MFTDFSKCCDIQRTNTTEQTKFNTLRKCHTLLGKEPEKDIFLADFEQKKPLEVERILLGTFSLSLVPFGH